MEDPKSSVSDLTPRSDQPGSPTERAVPPARQDRRGQRPSPDDPVVAPSGPGSLTDSEAFELLAVGMTDASDALAPPAAAAAEVVESEARPMDDDDPVIVGNPGDGSVGNDISTTGIDRAYIADAMASADADLRDGETGTDLSDARSMAGGISADCDDLPPLVVIPDEQRNHRRNKLVRPIHPKSTAHPESPERPESTERPESMAAGEEGEEKVILGRLADQEELLRAKNPELEPAATVPAAGAVDEIERIYENYAGPVVAVAATLLTDQVAINDTLYETFATAWRAASSFDSVGPKGPWLFTLARRSAHHRATSTEVRGEERASEIYPAPSHRGESVTGLDEAWEAWEVRLALEQLPLSDRNVLRLTHYQGLIHSEIALELAIPVGMVKSRAYAGSRRLVELLDHVIRPQARRPADDDLASALTWYLSGLADGSELDERQRQSVKRIRHQLSSAPVWIQPAPAVRSRITQLAGTGVQPSGQRPQPKAGDEIGRPTSLGRTTVQYDMAEAEDLFYTRGRHELPVDDTPDEEIDVASKTRSSVVVPALVAIGLFALTWMGWRSMSGSDQEAVSDIGGAQTDVAIGELQDGDNRVPAGAGVGDEDAAGLDLPGSADTTLVYELMATDVDPEARALVLITPNAGGAEFELQIQALDPTVGDQFLAAWLVNGDQWGRSGGSGGQAETDPTVQLVEPGRTGESTNADDMPLAIPLGSFQWTQESGGFRFSSATVDDRFDTIVVTRQRPADPIGPSGPVVFFGALDS